MHLNITCKRIAKSNSVLRVCIITCQFNIKVKLIANISTICDCPTLYKLWQADARFDSSCPGEESTSCLCSSSWRTQTCRPHWRAWPQHVGPEHIQTDAWRHVGQVGPWHEERRHVRYIEELTLLDHNILVRNIFWLEHTQTDARRHVGHIEALDQNIDNTHVLSPELLPCSSNWRMQTCRASWSRTWSTETWRASNKRANYAWPLHVGLDILKYTSIESKITSLLFWLRHEDKSGTYKN